MANQGLHTLRLIGAGVFDRYPKLQIIIGHMGEMIPYFLSRIDGIVTPVAEGLNRSVAEYFHRNVHVTRVGFSRLPRFTSHWRWLERTA